jgi:pseudouridine-5'-phosphate glycosidase
MPAFYSLSSRFAVDERVETGDEIAAIATARDKLGLTNAILITVPVPKESAIEAAELESILDTAVRSASEKRIGGKDVTPFLLSELSRATGGRTMQTNIALLENNARVATDIARSLA